METVSIRELRQNWPAVEKRLTSARELTVTRDGEAVAELRLPAKLPAAAGRRFNATEHAKWVKKLWGKRKLPFTTEQLIAESRAERNFSAPK